MTDLSQYFKNELTDSKSEEVTKALMTNHFERELKESYKNELQEKYNIAAPQNKKSNRFSLSSRRWVAAASFLLCVVTGGLFLLLNNTGPQSQQASLLALVEEELSEHPAYATIRKSPAVDENTAQAKRDVANVEFNQKNYQTAVASFNEVLRLEPGTIEDHFYLGLSHLKLDQSGQAIPFLQKALTLPATNDFSDVDVINWYLSLAYIKNDQLDLARKTLEELLKGNRLKDDSVAKNMLEKIKAIQASLN